MLDRVGDPCGLIDVGNRLVESAKLGQADGQLSACRDDVAIGEGSVLVFEEADGPGRGINGTSVVPLRAKRMREVVPGQRDHGLVVRCLSDREGAQARLEGEVVLGEAVLCIRDVGFDASQAERIPEGFGARPSLAQTLETPWDLAERLERLIEAHATIGSRFERRAALRPAAKCPDGLFELPRRAVVGRSGDRFVPGPLTVGRGLLPTFASKRMVGELLDVLAQPIGVQPLDGVDDLAVQCAATLQEQTIVRDIVGQCVLEGVLQLRKHACLIEQLGPAQVGQGALEVGRRHIGDRLQQRERHSSSDDGGGLQDLLCHTSKTIDPGGEDRLDRGRHADCLDRVRKLALPLCTDERAMLDEVADAFFEEEGVAFRPRVEQLLH